ncbi:LysE family translocator [Afifella sp. YEN Y35]|uniref:LysE family translocator n=1 Tax=Afifella sp. YEN Y35 TaxID=3388337 RepID=UPI0039E03353
MDALASLLLFALIATASPGGATTLATISGANFGFRQSLPLIVGISVGLASMAALAGFGLAGLLLTLPSLALGMKVAGSVYLLWLAWQTACRSAPRLDGNAKPNGFFAGLWMLWHNPKGWAMTTGAAAAFVAMASSPGQLGVLLGTVFGTFALASLSFWCVAGLMLARAVRSDGQWRILNRALGLLLACSVVPVWL